MKFSLKEIRKIRAKYTTNGAQFEELVRELMGLGVDIFDISVDNGVEQYYGPYGLVFVTSEDSEKVVVNTKASGVGAEYVARDYRSGLMSLLEFRQRLALLGIEWVRVDISKGLVEYHNADKSIIYAHKLWEKLE